MTTLDDLNARLGALRGGLKRLTATVGLLGLAAVLLWVVGIFTLADIAIHFSTVSRWLGLGLLLVGLTVVLVATWRRLARRLSAQNMAVRVERVRPEFANRLINVLQLDSSERERDRAVAAHLLAERDLPLQGVQPRELFPMQILKYAAILAGLGLLLSGVIAAVSPRAFVTSCQRLLLPAADIAPFSLTRIVALAPGAAALPRGDAVTISVSFAGALPRTARVELQVGGRESATLAMQADAADAARFSVETPVLYEDARYRVLGGDTRSPWHAIRVDSPPALSAWKLAVTPPAYTGRAPAAYDQDAVDPTVPVGSDLRLSVHANAPLRAVALLQGETTLATVTAADQPDAELVAAVPGAGPLSLRLVGVTGLESRVALPVALLPDQAPTVDFSDVDARVIATADATLPLTFRARDDYGLAEIQLEQVDAEGGRQTLATATVEPTGQRQFQGRFLLEMKTFRLKPPASVRVRLVAYDGGPAPETRPGRSRIVEIVVPLPDARKQAREDQTEQARESVARLIKLQQENLDFSRQVEKRAQRDMPISDEAAGVLHSRQQAVRDLAAELLKLGDALGDLQTTLGGLHEREMAQAVEIFAQLGRAGGAERPDLLVQAMDLEVRILSVLLGLPPQLDFERQYQAKSDVLALLQRLVKDQRDNLKASRKATEGEATGDAVADLVVAQEDIADNAAAFLEVTGPMLSELGQDDFAVALGEARKLLDDGKAYEKALTAADQLQRLEWPAAIQGEEECLTLFMKALDIMNSWRAQSAKKRVEELAATLSGIVDTLKEMEEKQSRITEKTRDLEKRGELTDELRAELAAMDEEQKAFIDMIEKMAQDLYQFPDLPVANELNSKMREVYEDVEQALDSDKLPSSTIAVQKEDALLDAIAATKKRAEDIEMWLMDIPDVVKWDMETFDAAEFPDMPLVPLPDELEDLVGDLLDQAAESEMDAQDATGNNMMADGVMGWGVMDGPMPNFSAKGKSGNTKPNDNEMPGRSGAGREGQAVGELAENKVKGLEGRDTHARKTNDPFQKGQVEEEEGSTLDARATGGGKLGGESETDGMFGDAPRRDAHLLGQRSDQNTELRQDAEALYTTARLLYLSNTQSLGDAASTLRLVERADETIDDFDALKTRVIRRLEDSHTEISTGASLPMPVNTRTTSGGTAVREDVDLDAVDESYRDIVSDYYKNLAD